MSLWPLLLFSVSLAWADRVCQTPDACRAAFEKLKREYNDPNNPDPARSLVHMRALRESIRVEIEEKKKFVLMPGSTRGGHDSYVNETQLSQSSTAGPSQSVPHSTDSEGRSLETGVLLMKEPKPAPPPPPPHSADPCYPLPPSVSKRGVCADMGSLRSFSLEVAKFTSKPPPPGGKSPEPPPTDAVKARNLKAAREDAAKYDPASDAGGREAGRIIDDMVVNGSPADADKFLHKNLDNQPGNGLQPDKPGAGDAVTEAMLNIGEGYAAKGDEAGAERLLGEAIKRDPDNPEALAGRAQARLALGRREEAVADAQAALRLDPQNERARLIAGYGDMSSEARRVLSRPPAFGAREGAGELAGGGARDGGAAGGAGASAVYAAAAGGAGPGARGPGLRTIVPPAPMAPGVEALLRLAQAKARAKDYAGALVDLAQALDSDPKNPLLLTQRAEILNALGQHAAALKDAEAVLALTPLDPRALRAKAYALLGLGRDKEALEAARLATELDPGNGLGWLYRAMAEEKLGLKDEAIAHYRRAMELDPTLSAAALEGLKRLGAGASPRPADAPAPWLLRAGFWAVALALIIAGLLGTQSGRRAVKTASRWLTGRVGAAAEEQEAAAAARTLPAGATLGGHFQIVGELGRGGMGVVYEAEDLALQRRVAIKQLQGTSSPQDMARFLAEARLAAKLRHPGLAEILTVIEDGDVYLVFEFLEGETLDKFLRRRGHLPPAEARALLAELCAALDFAHGRKIIHRDLKPSNVMIVGEGTCKVMDLGIAHQATSHDATRTAAAGTPPYMAPEQMMGSVSRAADLYALGIMAYELMAGARPFSGPNFLEQKLDLHFTPISQLSSGLPAGLDAFFRRVLAADPRHRPQTAGEFLREFDKALA